MISSSLFIFILWREFKLSIAEIHAVFPAAHFEFVDEQIAMVGNIPREEIVARFPRLGGTIKVIEVLGECRDGVEFMDLSAQYLADIGAENKLSFAVASYREKLDNFAMGLRIKKLAKWLAKSGSFRLVNKDPKNINSAVYKKEGLVEHETEMNSIVIGSTRYFGRTCAYQDVDLYAARDIGKERDMEVGMLPPKLAQMMVNLTGKNESVFASGAKQSRSNQPFLKVEDPETSSGWQIIESAISSGISSRRLGGNNEEIPDRVGDDGKAIGIYDPFCGLGTILIEAANMGYARLLASDLSPEMVRATEVNVREFIEKPDIRHRDPADGRAILGGESPSKIAMSPAKADSSQWRDLSVFRADASRLSDFVNAEDLKGFSIATEWYLGEIMSARTVTDDRIASERRKLGRMYDGFFGALRRLRFDGNIVISFPFWEIRGKYVYLEEWYEAFKRHGFVAERLLPEDIAYQETRSGSLLYKRPWQIVGREILKLRLSQ